MTSRLKDRCALAAHAVLVGLRRALKSAQGVAAWLVRLQTLIGLALLYFAVATLWRPAGALLVIGSLLVLDEIVMTLRRSRP